MCKESGINGFWEINEAQLTILETCFIDDGNSIACADEHGSRVTIVLICYIERTTVRADPGDKGYMPSRAESPHTVCNRKDSYRARPRSCSQGQAVTFCVDNPISCIAPVERKIIAEQVPLLPCPPNTVTPCWVGAGTEWERVAIG